MSAAQHTPARRRGNRMNARIRIRRLDGKWYAFASGGIKKRRDLQLFVSISYCEKLNAKATGSAA